jgi:hypothetical protein
LVAIDATDGWAERAIDVSEEGATRAIDGWARRAIDASDGPVNTGTSSLDDVAEMPVPTGIPDYSVVTESAAMPEYSVTTETAGTSVAADVPVPTSTPV